MKNKLLGFMLVLVLLLSACSPLSADILFGNQEAAVETMVAATMAFLTLTPPVTLTPQPSPTITDTPQNTPRPTGTDFPTETLQPTVTPFTLPTITPFGFGIGTASADSTASSGAPIQGSGEYACQLISTEPAGTSRIDGKTKFNAVWKLLNAGSLAWNNEGVELVFLDGKKTLHDISNVTLITRDLYPGETYTVKVNMLAPTLDGLYVSNWGLRKGNNVFCKFGIRFIIPPK